MDYSDKSITMKDGREYIVIEQVNLDGNTYLYIVNDKDDNDTRYVEIKDNNILKIDPKLFEEKVFPLFMEKMSNY